MSNEYDAFLGGVSLGGLRSRSEIRLLICYLLKSLDAALPRNLIIEAVLQEGLANYFELNQAFDELVKNGQLRSETEDDEEVFKITDTGREIAELLETNLTRTVRDKAVRAAVNLLTVHRREKENSIVIEKTDRGYNIKLEMYATANDKKEGRNFFSLSLFTSDAMQAEIIKKGFLKDPVKLCEMVISKLLNDE